jgi:exopolyphosphatase/guanosine-5'-triphosphate,3'-diphosphate pyrophosphatase
VTRAAAIDIGTNTMLMLVAERDAGGSLVVVEDHCRTPRLGAGLATCGAIAPEAMARGLAVLRGFAARLSTLGLRSDARRCVGTAVLRRASNAGEFVARARDEAGLDIQVVSGEDEARLAWAAASAGRDAHDLAVVDVGGGSTEVACAGGVQRVSVAVGAVVLSERFASAAGEFDDRGWAALQHTVRAECAAFDRLSSSRAVVLGGTGANLAALVHGFARFDALRTEGLSISAAAAARWAEELRGIPVARRCALPIESERAAILPAGLACLALALERLGTASAVASGRGLRFAVASELLSVS